MLQSSIILQYIEERWPEPALLPGDPFERARVRMLEGDARAPERRATETGHPRFTPAVRSAPRKRSRPASIAASTAIIASIGCFASAGSRSSSQAMHAGNIRFSYELEPSEGE